MTRRPAYPQITDDRPGLSQDTEFRRFLVSRQADEQREADRLQDEIDTLMAQADSKRQEQTERLNIVMACAAGIAAIDGKALRPAPQLTPHSLGDLPTASGSDPLGEHKQEDTP